MGFMIEGAQSAVKEIIKVFQNMGDQLNSLFDELSKNWSQTMAEMAQNAKDGAKAVIKELNKIPTKIVTTHITRHVDSRAEGGIMSAASGRVFTVNREQTITVGDNPGGHETVAFIPHNNPNPTMELLESMFGMGTKMNTLRSAGGAGGSAMVGQPIIQVFLDGEQVKGKIIKMIVDKQGGHR